MDDPAWDSVKVEEKIKEVEQRFNLVMITEHWDQSLVLMKDELCWHTEDLTSLKARNIYY